MELLTIISMLALLQFFYFAVQVGGARGKYGVSAPATTGNEVFERYFRVHYNTMEHLVLFLPGLWAFGFYVSYVYAAALGAVYLLGRLIYAVTYVKNPKSREIGAIASTLPCIVLVVGALVGAVMKLFG
ncbi:MAPEG family protein [Alteromonadaceae bacterium BrNp21-10]|nr:MAPEG family protein [Alteromonadaceae bacterium BrNp21-10]